MIVYGNFEIRDSQWSDTSGDGADDTSYDESSSGGDGDYTEDNGDYSEDDSEGY